MTTTTPLLHSALASDRPLFSRQRVSHQPPHPVTHLATSNLQVILVLANKTVHRFNQSKKAGDGNAGVEVVDFSKLCAGNARVNGAYLDPLGAHLVLSLRPSDPEGQPDLIYLGKRSQRFRPSGKIKGNLVTSVSWFAKNTSEVTSGPMLLGTSKGVVYETELESKEDRMFSSSFDKYFKVLVDLGKGQHMPITGLSYFNVEGTKR